MFRSIKEAVDAYKKELANYKVFSDQIIKKYPADWNVQMYDEPDRSDILHRAAVIAGMEKALGLTREEVLQFSREAGFPV